MTESLKILLVEDNPGDATLIKYALKESIYKDATLFVASRLDDALAYKDQGILLLIFDLGLPDSDGMDTVKQIHDNFFESALIVLTGLQDENVAVQTMREGVQSYLNKNEIDNKVLERTIRFSLERHQIVQQLKVVEKELSESKYFLERAQAIASVGSWVLDLQTNKVFWSPETLRIFGFKAGEFSGDFDAYLSMLAPDDLEATQRELRYAIAEKKRFELTHKVKRKDGVVRWVNSQADVIFENETAVKLIGSVHDITEKKAAQESLENSEQKHRALVENNDSIISLVDENFNTLYRSPSAQRIIGWTLNEINLGTDNVGLIHPDDVEYFKQVVSKAIANEGITFTAHFRLQHKLGHFIALEGSIKNMLNVPGVEGIVTNFRDVTERNKMQDALQKSETLYRGLFNNMLNGFVLCKVVFQKDKVVDYKYVSTNDLFSEITGLHNIQGKYVSEVIPGFYEAGQDYFDAITRVVTTHKPEVIEIYIEFLKKYFSVSLYSPEDGHFVAVVENITVRKQFESQQSLLASIVNSSDDAIISESLDGIITSWNIGATRLFGYTADEIIGKKFEILTIDSSSLEKGNQLSRALPQFSVKNYETKLFRKNEAAVDISLTISIIEDDKGQAIGMSKIVHDITERKNAKQRLIKANRLYAFISHINQAIVHIKNKEALFKKACKIAVEQGDFAFAFIGSFSPEPGKLSLEASHGTTASDIQMLQDYEYEENGSIKKVLEGMTYSLTNDISERSDVKIYRYLEQRGVRSVISLAIKNEGKPVSVFVLHSNEINFFDTDEVLMLKEVANDISFALEIFDKEKKQRETEELIIKNEKRFRALIEKSTDMKSLTTDKGIVLYGSPSITQVLGYEYNEFATLSVFDFMHPDDLPGYLEKRRWVMARPGASFYYQQRVKHKDGHWLWCENIVTNLLDEPGVNGMVGNFRDITERKIAEQQREFDQNNLNALINSTNDLMWSIDREFNLITYNEAFEDFIKLFRQTTIKKGINLLDTAIPSDRVSHYSALYERAFSGEVFTELEHTQGDLESWSEVSYYPIRSGGNIIGTACYSRDITMKIRAEKQLRKSEAFSREVLNSLSSHIVVIDGKGTIVAVNDSWNSFATTNNGNQLLLGMGGDTKNYLKVCEKSAKEGDIPAKEVLHGIRDLMRKKISTYSIEYPCHETTSQRWFSLLAKKFENDENLIVISNLNISERKLTEESLVKSEARLKEAEKVALIGNWEIDLVNNKYTWSDGFYAILGIQNDDQPSLELFLKCVHSADLDFVVRKITKAFSTSIDSSFSFRFSKRYTDEIRFGFLEYRFTLGTTQKPTRLYGIFKDVTDQKNAEIEREKILNDIIQRNKELEQFAFIVSHNLRLPVANIKGFADILKDDELDEAQKEDFISAITTSVNNLDEVVNDLNQVLRISREITEKKEAVTFSSLVDTISSSIQHTIALGNVEVIKDFGAIDQVFTLKSYLYSVFYNLISNSIKYCQKEVPLVLEIKSAIKDEKIILSFKDNGSGIDLVKNGAQVFGLYKRFHGKIEGKGMGLFMVKKQVETLGGKINIKSMVNQGTEFIIEFDRSQLN